MAANGQAEANKALVQQFVEEFWNRGDLTAADELMTREAVIHEPVMGTPKDLKVVATMIRSAFPDWHSSVEEMFVDGDRVVERWTGRGTHRGEFQGIPPDGQSGGGAGGRLLPHRRRQDRRVPRAVRSDEPDAAAGCHPERQRANSITTNDRASLRKA